MSQPIRRRRMVWSRGRTLALVAGSLSMAVGAAGCAATKGDMRILQDELRALRSSIARSDTAQRAKTDSATMLVARVNDSLRLLSTRLMTFQANVSGGLYDMGRLLIQIQELSGQSQRRLQEIRASLETRMEAMNAGATAPMTPATPVAPDTSRPAAGPGPAQLFQVAFDQMQRGSFGVARAGFQDLLNKYPTFDAAPMAQLYIGQSLAEEKNVAGADSVYQLVVQKYPQSKAASTALYKYALSLIAQKKTAPAKDVLNRIVKEYPTSDEASLARDLLRTVR